MAKENTAQLVSIPLQSQQQQPPAQLLLQEEFWAAIAAVAQERPRFEVVYDMPRVLMLIGTIRLALSLTNFPDRSRQEMTALVDELLAQFEGYPGLHGTMKGEWIRFLQRTSGGK